MINSIECFNEKKILRLKQEISKVSYADEATLFHALSNARRLKVLHILKLEPCCVCDLSQIMDCPVPTVSQYLRILKKAELLDSRKEGKFIIYSLSTKAQKLQLL
ncbi:ArsR/SmtB family transcription factor [Lentisphaera marina]|uniref:ArsR/SmtB family transcription factor n=1 Tax=Lentisphaera marina TaxID=1111041 RepID=UPI003B681F1C